MKRILAFLMALAMLCTVGATAAFAATAPSPTKPSTPVVIPHPVDVGEPVEPFGDGHLLEEVLAGSADRRKAWEDALAARESARGQEFDAEIVDAAGHFIKGVYVKSDEHPNGELIITPVSAAQADKADPRIDKDLLLKYYNELKNSSNPASLIPDLANGFVLRDVFDVSLVGASGLLITLPGLYLKVNFALNLGKTEPVLGYQANTARTGWEKTAGMANNGDGSATMTLAHLCPVAILVKGSSSVESPRTADISANALWVLAAVCGVGAVVVLTVSRKRSKAN